MGKLVCLLSVFLSCSVIQDKYSNSNIYRIDRDYYENGKLRYESNYMHGKLNGESKSWDIHGNLISSVQYKNGLLHGKWESYYSLGVLKHTVNYIDGNKNGKELWFHSNGQLQSEGYYINGSIDSEIRRWDENGDEITN